MSGGQGTGEIVLLNLNDLVLLILDCLPAARKPAAAAMIGVATGSAAAAALANAARNDADMQAMRAGASAGIPQEYAATGARAGDPPMTEDLRSGLSSSVLHPSPRLPWQDVAMAAVGQIIRTNQVLEIIRLEVVQMRQPRVVMSPLVDWVSNNIIPTTGSVITMPQMCAAINSDKLYGNHVTMTGVSYLFAADMPQMIWNKPVMTCRTTWFLQGVGFGQRYATQ